MKTLFEITKSNLDKKRNSLKEKTNIENPFNGLIENQIKDFDEKIGNINSLEINIKRQNWKFWFDGFWRIEKILLPDFL